MGRQRKSSQTTHHPQPRSQQAPPSSSATSESQYLKEKIFQSWFERVHRSSLPSRHLDSYNLTDYLPVFLERLIQLITSPDPESELSHLRRVQAERMARSNKNFGYADSQEILEEYHLLQQAVLDVLEGEGLVHIDQRNLVLNAIFTTLQFTFFELQEKNWNARQKAEAETNRLLKHQLEKEVQEIERKTQEHWLEKILERFPIAVVLINPHDGQVIFANQETSRLMGNYPKQMSLDADDGFYATDIHGNPIPVSQMMRFRVARGEKLRNYEIYWNRAGRQIPLMVTGELIPPMLGHSATVLIMLQDITDQVQARETLKQSEERFRTLADTLPQLVWTASPSGGVDYLNRRWMDYTGAEDPVFECANWLDRVHPEDQEESYRIWRKCISSGVSLSREHRIRNTLGTYHWFLVNAVPIIDSEGKVVKWFGTCTDIDEQKKMMAAMERACEMAEAASQTKSSFLANVSHEIRTPLGAILGFAELLKDPDLSAKDRKYYFDVIERNGNALTRILDDVLDLSKVEAGHLQIVRTTFSLSSLVTETMDIFRDTALAKGLGFHLHIAEGTPDLICSDPARLRQILVNLIGNAIKFTAKGEVNIHVSSSPIDLSHHLFSIEVEDTGPGLTADQARLLFRPFTQADNSVTRKFGGTGLGLALSKRLAQALQGDVKIKNCELDKGCNFEVSFPAEITVSTSNQVNLPPTH